MQINLTGQQIDLTAALHDYVNSKMERLARHFDHVGTIHVVLKIDKQSHIAEATLHLPGGKGDIHAISSKEDMYAAIDTLVDKLDRQILKHKDKLHDHHRKEKKALDI